MKIEILEALTRTGKLAEIERASKSDMPLKKDGWQFAWRKLYGIEGVDYYKLVLLESKSLVEGMLMLTLMNNEMLYMNNIEIAPHNIGKGGKYDRVAGCLIAFACRKSMVLGKGNYAGYLAFESKTELIPLYQKRYGAMLARGQRMFIDPEAGLSLIAEYLP